MGAPRHRRDITLWLSRITDNSNFFIGSREVGDNECQLYFEISLYFKELTRKNETLIFSEKPPPQVRKTPPCPSLPEEENRSKRQKLTEPSEAEAYVPPHMNDPAPFLRFETENNILRENLIIHMTDWQIKTERLKFLSGMRLVSLRQIYAAAVRFLYELAHDEIYILPIVYWWTLPLLYVGQVQLSF